MRLLHDVKTPQNTLWIWLRIVTSGGFCEQDKETSGSIKTFLNNWGTTSFSRKALNYEANPMTASEQCIT
jgi:hypothetical protein